MLTKSDKTLDRTIKIFDDNSIQHFLGGSRRFGWWNNNDDFDVIVYSDNFEKLLLILQHLGFKDNMKDLVHIIIIHNEESFLKKKLIHEKLVKKMKNPKVKQMMKKLKDLDPKYMYKKGPFLYETLKLISEIKPKDN